MTPKPREALYPHLRGNLKHLVKLCMRGRKNDSRYPKDYNDYLVAQDWVINHLGGMWYSDFGSDTSIFWFEDETDAIIFRVWCG